MASMASIASIESITPAASLLLCVPRARIIYIMCVKSLQTLISACKDRRLKRLLTPMKWPFYD